jgi:hypothetical protein
LYTDGDAEGYMVFQAAIYAIKAFITENTEKSYTGKKIYILCDRQS